MAIESHYWREDLARYANSFKAVKKPPRWSERLVVNFEKDVTIALFIVRRLAEAGKFSSKMKNHKVKIFRCAFTGEPHSLVWRDIERLYDLETEEAVARGVIFVCNQFIHADMTYAYRDQSRNWAGLYTSSDYEKRKWIYRIPIAEITKILNLGVVDYPGRKTMKYDAFKQDWVITTD